MRDQELGAVLGQAQLRALGELIGSLEQTYPAEVRRLRASLPDSPLTSMHSPTAFATAVVGLLALVNRRLEETAAEVEVVKHRRGRPPNTPKKGA